MSNKSTQKLWLTRTGTLSQLVREILNAFPKWSEQRAREFAKESKRVRISKYLPHYGVNAAARNMLHRANGTHGL